MNPILMIEESLGEFLVYCNNVDMREAHDLFLRENPGSVYRYRFFKDGFFILVFGRGN